MSLHHAAHHLASQGRHGDTMLVHMNPKEVAGLQALAHQKGTSLTINPHTGMPEAFSLGDLNPFRIVQGKGEIGESGLGGLLIGAALNMAFPGLGALQAGLLTGGATLAMGGNARQAIGQGLGAYGGASMMGGAGAAPHDPSAVQVSDAVATPVAPAAAPVMPAAPTAPTEYFGNAGTTQGIAQTAPVVTATPMPVIEAPVVTPTTTGPLTNAQVDVGLGKPGTYTPVNEASFMDKTKAFGKEYAWPLAGLGALALTQEKPKGVEAPQIRPGKIRPYTYDPNTGALTQLSPYDAPGYAGGGDVYQDPNLQQVPSFDPVVRMAGGGVTGSGSIQLNVPVNVGDGGGGQFGQQGMRGGFNGYNNSGGGLDYRAISANPQGFSSFMQGAQRQEQMYPGSTMFSQMGSAGISGLMGYASGGNVSTLGDYSDGGRLLKGPGDGVSDSIPATISNKQPARLADGEFVVPARIVSELGNGSTDAGARKLYAMMDRVQKARGRTTGKNRIAANTRSDKYLPA